MRDVVDASGAVPCLWRWRWVVRTGPVDVRTAATAAAVWATAWATATRPSRPGPVRTSVGRVGPCVGVWMIRVAVIVDSYRGRIATSLVSWSMNTRCRARDWIPRRNRGQGRESRARRQCVGNADAGQMGQLQATEVEGGGPRTKDSQWTEVEDSRSEVSQQVGLSERS